MIFVIVKKATAFIFSLLFATQTFYSASITAWFHLNRTYIASKFCVNKTKPELRCNGKCFLSKKLKEAEKKQEQQLPQQVKQWVEISPCTISTISYTIQIPSNTLLLNPEKRDSYRLIIQKDIFHPPAMFFS
jgi:hypothetical protein